MAGVLVDQNGNMVIDVNGNAILDASSLAQYNLLRSHYLPLGEYAPGTVITEGTDVPYGWTPTLGVDPQNPVAVDAFYAAGPKDNCQEALNWWADTARIKPVTYWQQAPSGGPIMYWTLTGLGASLPWLPIGGFMTVRVLMTQDGRPITTEDGREIIVT